MLRFHYLHIRAQDCKCLVITKVIVKGSTYIVRLLTSSVAACYCILEQQVCLTCICGISHLKALLVEEWQKLTRRSLTGQSSCGSTSKVMHSRRRTLWVSAVGRLFLTDYRLHWWNFCVGDFIVPIANLKGHYFQPSLSVCVCVSMTGTSTLQRWPILTKLGHKDPTLI